MNSTVITNAVKLTNEANQAAAEREAVRLIGLIRGEQSSIRSCNGRIEEKQKALKAIADASITESGILGDIRLPSGFNTEVIKKAIEKANKDAQDQVNLASTNLVQDITNEQKNIEAAQKRINEYRDKLIKLSSETVTERSIVG